MLAKRSAVVAHCHQFPERSDNLRRSKMQPIEAMLRAVPGFSHLNGDVLEHVAISSDLAEPRPGEVLFREGSPPETLYVLLEGRVSLTGTAADASSAVIDILEPNSSFILANVLADEPYLMGAQTVGSSLLIRIPAEPMRAAVTADTSAMMAVMRAMADELGTMTRQVVDLKARIAAQRLGTYLLSLVKESTTTEAAFRLPISKGLLAQWLGCRAENLSRAFTALRAFGVETHGSRVVLHDVSRLRAYAGALEPVRRAGSTSAQSVERAFSDAFNLRPRPASGD
jgi:CRP/FNR family transcriptional activator FtrB